MLPKINGKDIIDCELSDLQEILDNPSFAENEYLDYKKSFTIDEVPKEQKLQEQIELRNDVCSFANAEGGYLFFGIKETKGIPTNIAGFTIKGNNRDLFERELKNYLQSIKPRIPYYQIKFIELPNHKYVVILFIQHDFFAPYTHLVEEKEYHFYKRIGNAKRYIEYQELRTMFTQSLSLEKEIEKFRKERIEFFMSQEDDNNNSFSQFLLLHIIPDTFLASNYDKPMFALEKEGARFSTAFDALWCSSRPYPMVEGLRYLGREVTAECRLYNNGVTEYFCPLREKRLLCSENGVDYIITDVLWDTIKDSLSKYLSILNKVIAAKRVFVGFSLIGCKNAITYRNWCFDVYSRIDRDRLISTPIAFENISSEKAADVELAKLHLCFLTSLGISSHPQMDDLLKTVYGNNKELTKD